MGGPNMRPGWLSIVAWLLGGVCCWAAERTPAPVPARSSASALLPLVEGMPEAIQAKARVVIEKPAMYARGPAEAFRCQPRTYHWLLDNPDRACRAWHKMGAKCMAIADQGEGQFGCKDDQGTNVVWRTVLSAPDKRVWYAEGVVRPGLLLPLVAVRAIFVLHIAEGKDQSGRPAIRHHGELVLHTDSKAAALATRILGASAPRMAEQYVGQIQTFFAAMAWYLNEHPQKTKTLFAD